MPLDGLEDETLPGKQEQHREWATVLSLPRGLGYVLSPSGTSLSPFIKQGALKTFLL